MGGRREGYVIHFAALVVALAVAFSGSSSLAQKLSLQAAREQPLNVIYVMEFGANGIPRISSASVIPAENFHFDPIPKKTLVGRPSKRMTPKIHPLLQEQIEGEAPNRAVEVIITFRDDQKVPRLPRLMAGQPRTSPANQAVIQARQLLIEELGQRRKKSQVELIKRLQSYGLVVREQYWLVNSLRALLPIGSVSFIAAQPEVLYIQLKFSGERPPSSDDNPDNDVADARAQIQSDPYFDSATSASTIAVFDSGVHSSHILFQEPSHLGALLDCVRGGSQCQRKWFSFGYNPADRCDHGTSTIGIITGNGRLGNDFRGVAQDIVDSFKVYGERFRESCGLNVAAVIRAFEGALALGDDLIVAEMQAQEDETGAIATAADKAYDAGGIIIAANGNCALDDACLGSGGGPRPSTVRSPALAHKVIGVGAYDVESPHATPDYQSRGPAPDGRIKPDVQSPTNTETASSASDEALDVFTGTSGSTPYAGAAAALIRNWLLDADSGFGPFDNGQVYAWLIASGQAPYPFFDNIQGTGHVKLLLGGTAIIGKVSVSQGQTVEVDFATSPGDRRIDAAIWWPESAAQQHNDIDIRIIDPFGAERSSSSSVPSIFERARVDGSPLAVGTWKLRIQGYDVPAGPQTVYLVVHRTDFVPVGESPWRMFGHDPQHTGRTHHSGPQSIDIAWMYDLGFDVNTSYGGTSEQPLIGSGNVMYFGMGERQYGAKAPWGKLYAFNF